jgi:hypothetical protein
MYLNLKSEIWNLKSLNKKRLPRFQSSLYNMLSTFS